jgi:rhodanese-related sulfurtransferase
MPTLDVRSKRGRTQIRGALRYDPKALMSQERLALPLPHDGMIVIYADDDARAEEIAQRLQEQGFHNVAVLAGGFEAYEEAGFPTEDATQEQPIPGVEGAGIPRL